MLTIELREIGHGSRAHAKETMSRVCLIWVQRYLPPFQQVRAMKRTSLPDKASVALLKLRTLAAGDFNEAK